MSTFELSLVNKFQSIVNFNTIISNSQNTIFSSSGTINSNLFINGNTLLNNSASINSSLNVSGATIINNYASINSNLNISSNSNINFITVNSNISISNNTNLYNLTSNSIYINGNANITSSTTINSSLTLFNLITNNLSINSSLNVSGNTQINGSMTINSPFYVTSFSLLNNLSINTSLYVSNNSVIQGNTTILNNLYVSNNSILSGNNTILSNFNASGLSIINSFISIASNLNISNAKLNNTVINSNLSVSSSSILNGISINSSLIVSGNSILNLVTNKSSLYISGQSVILANMSINSNLYISGSAILNNASCNNITYKSSLYISGTSNFNNINILGNFVTKLPEYLYNTDAYINGIPLWGLYRTGGIVRVRIDVNPIYITLSGSNFITLYVGDTYIDPGLTTVMMVKTIPTETITTYITSIIASDLGEVLTSNILINSNATTISNSIINTSTNRTFTITYTSTSSTNLTSTISRIINVYLNPIINSITLSDNQKQINVSLSGQYYYSTYTITLNGAIVISETVFTSSIIDISSLTSNTLAYTITIKLKRSSGVVLASNTLTFNIDTSAPMITTSNPLILILNDNPIFNIYTSVVVIDSPTNNNISLNSSNIVLIQDSNGNNITIPSNGLLNTSLIISYTIIYTITDSIGNNSIIPFILNIRAYYQPPTSGLIFHVNPITYNSNTNLWIDNVNNATVIPTTNTIWNSTGNYFVIQNSNSTSQLSVTSTGLINNMRSIFLVLSFPVSGITNSRVLVNADLIQQNYISLTTTSGTGTYYSDLSFTAGYTDTVINNGIYDGKFHVYLATGMNWGNKSTLYFGAYNIPFSMSYPAGTRVAAVGIYNRVLNTTEISAIQTWFINNKFSLL